MRYWASFHFLEKALISPPNDIIFFAADSETDKFSSISFLVSFHLSKIFIFAKDPFLKPTSPFPLRVLGVTFSPELKFFSKTYKSSAIKPRPRLLKLLTLLLGIFIIKSLMAGLILCPERDLCPFVPLPEVVPRFPPRPIL